MPQLSPLPWIFSFVLIVFPLIMIMLMSGIILYNVHHGENSKMELLSLMW